MRKELDKKKIATLATANDMLDQKYGRLGEPVRDLFEARAKAWYYSEVLREARHQAGLTQKQLAEKVGKKREYIADLERGETDMQLSTFILLSETLGFQLTLTRI